MAAVRQRKVAEGLRQDTAGFVGNCPAYDAHYAGQAAHPTLIQHEWAMHGTCSGLSVQDYFGAIERLYNGLEVPPEFKKPTASAQTTVVANEQKFATANNAPKSAFRISCLENEFSAVEVCLSKELQYQACPNSVKECRAPHIEVKPAP